MDIPEIIGLAAGGVAALLIVVADFWRRKVRLLPLVLLLAGGIVFSVFHQPDQIWANLGINAAMVSAVLLLVLLLLRVLGNKGFINQRIGLGDVILMFAMGSWFPPAGFVLYFSTGLFFALGGVLALMALKWYRHDLPVPLAGLLAAYGLAFMPIFLAYEAEILLAFQAG